MIYKLNILLLTFLLFSSSIGYAQESDAKRKYDSLSRTGSIKDDRPKPTSYLFDSLFIVTNTYLKRNIQLAKTVSYAKLIYTSKDSSAFYTKTGKTVFLNGALLKQQKHYILIDRCSKSDVKILSQKALKERYGVHNPNGAYVIFCK